MPSSGSVSRNGIEVYAPNNKMILYKNGSFAFNDTSKEVKINGETCDASATYNTVKLDYNNGNIETIIYPAGQTYNLPVLENPKFMGWTDESFTEAKKEVVIPADFEGACTYIANWIAPKNIETCDISFEYGMEYPYVGVKIVPVILIKDGDK